MKTIEVVISGKKFPVRVTEDEEQVVLDTVEQIDVKLKEFQKSYPGMDKRDYLSMALLTYALDSAKNKGSDGLLDQIKSKTQSIFEALETAG